MVLVSFQERLRNTTTMYVQDLKIKLLKIRQSMAEQHIVNFVHSYEN